MADRFDVIIIGGGNAGFGVSAVAHEAGKTIAFIEERDFGGTCPNRGCTPKKVLVAAAHALHEIEIASAHGIAVGKPKLDWAALIDREQAMIASMPDAMAGVAQKRGTVFTGHAKFAGANSIDIDGTVIDGDNIVIATGSTQRALPIPGAEHMITSDDVLTERDQPKDVVFVGGGVIAMEFSHVYARAGTKVTILEALPRILPRLDADAIDVLKTETERLGVAIKTGVRVEGIAEAGARFQVTYSIDGTEHTTSADRVINGAGRVANVAGLNLEAGGIAHDGIAIDVDSNLRSTSNPAVWVCGDALVGVPQLSPQATQEGRIVGNNIVNGATLSPDYSAAPFGVFTVPAYAGVGLTEAEAHDAGIEVDVTVSDLTGWFSGRTYAETAAWAKVLVDKKSGRFVGAHMVGHSGEELIHLFAMAMRHNITASAMRDQPFAFPTFSADIKNLF